MDDLRVIQLDIDAGPFFMKALEADQMRSSLDADDTEGRPLVYPEESSEHQGQASQASPEKLPRKRTVVTPGLQKKKARLRQVKRALASRSAHLPSLYRPRLTTLRIIQNIYFSKTALNPGDLPVAAGCWIGKVQKPIKTTPWTIPELKARGFDFFHWDGKARHALLDREGRLLTILAACPTDQEWPTVVTDVNEAFLDARVSGEAEGALNAATGSHRRGNFHILVDGVSFGGGQKRPGNLRHTKAEEALLSKLKRKASIRRIVGFQDACFALYAPKLYMYYRTMLKALYSNQPGLKPNFPDLTIYPAVTFNLGPKTVTLDHTDRGNVAYGLCAITALGDYDPELGGHLILFDLNLVICFPPGSTILIPSGVFRHGNTPIQGRNAYRMSLTQYCAGGLFRWVHYGFRTAKDLVKSQGQAAKAKLDGDPIQRAKEALELFSKMDELERDRVDILRSSPHA